MTVASIRERKPVAVPMGTTAQGWSPRFGTDGIRGRANQELSPLVAMRLGRAVGSSISATGGCLAIGRDTRRSGDMLTAALIAGATSVGVDVVDLGVVPTAALAFAAARWPYDAGIMVSASHNPAADNGLKVVDGFGLKVAEGRERELEAELNRCDEPAGPGNHGLGRLRDGRDEVARYQANRLALARRIHAPVRIVVDCANGSASAFAAETLSATGAYVTVVQASPDGANINDGCGATAPNLLAAKVRENAADLGFAFDGDADRCVAVDETGRVIDGDALLGLLAIDRMRRGSLARGTLVATVQSNEGLVRTLERHGARVVRTPVGDRSVWVGMADAGASLGGEKSGHVIFRELATTGDGILTAIEVIGAITRSGQPLSELASQVSLWPQQERAIHVPDRDAAMADPVVSKEIASARERLGASSRILVRPSGTEPLVRIMVEGPDRDRVTAIADGLADLVRQRHPQR